MGTLPMKGNREIITGWEQKFTGEITFCVVWS